MNRTAHHIVAILCVAVSMVSIAACDSQDGPEQDDLYVVYQAHISEAQRVVGDHMIGAVGSDKDYYTSMLGHLEGMGTIRRQMEHLCGELSNCPQGGGAGSGSGGHMSNHMGGGHMLDGHEMGAMHDREMSMKHELDNFAHICIGQNADQKSCDAIRPDHFDHMMDLLHLHMDQCEAVMGDHHGEMHDQDCHMGDCDDDDDDDDSDDCHMGDCDDDDDDDDSDDCHMGDCDGDMSDHCNDKMGQSDDGDDHMTM